MEEANPLCVDKNSGSIAEIEELPEDFRKLLHTKLNLSRLEAGGGESGSTGWVFWDRQDDRPNTLPVSDLESVNVIPNFSPKVTKVKDKIRLALERIPLHPQYGPSLVQFWAATEIEGRTLLTTQNQPFALGKMGRSTRELCEYRMKSMEHKFYGDIRESREEELGLPGRVFLHGLPESTPDVQCYSLKEYPQRADASRCQVRASWALPVFNFSNRVCVGVLELVSTVNAIIDWQDKSFLDNLYGVLQDQGLQSFNVYSHCVKDEDKALTTAFHELSLVLKSVCKSHKLPLALTWVPCNDCDGLLLGQRLCEDGEYLGAFKANDGHLVNFLITSTGHHLWNGHVAAKLVGSTSMLYCSDVTQFSIAEHPLAPFARQCKLSGWFTIWLKSSWTGDYVYILEFFLPASSKDNEDMTTISTILGTMKANSKTFKLGSGEELGEELSVSVLGFQNGQRQDYAQTIQASLELLKNGGQTLSVIGVDNGMDVINAEQNDKVTTISEGDTTKTLERKRKKTGVRLDISLEDILRFSALSSKDAARGLKVSESTLERDCRKHGIHWWPPRDINKEEVFPLAVPNVVHFDSPEELEVDATLNGPHDVGSDLCWPSRSFTGAEHSNSEEGTIAMQKGKNGKTGVQCSKMRLDDAARELNVGLSTSERFCWDHGIHQWPPCKIDEVSAPQPSPDVLLPDIDKVGTPQPSCAVLEEGISQLTSDIPSNQASASRDCRIHPGPPQNINEVGAQQPSHVEHEEGSSELTVEKEKEMVTIKAKCSEYTMKFSLPISSGVKELQEQVAMRLKPEAGNYYINYEDEDGELIIIACDADVHDCITFFRSQGNKTVSIVILPRPK